MGACIDTEVIDRPLTELTPDVLSLAIVFRHRTGALAGLELTSAIIHYLAVAIRLQDGAGIARFLNTMNACSPPHKKISAHVDEVGIIPNPADDSDSVLIALGADGNPVADADGNTMAYSIRGICAYR